MPVAVLIDGRAVPPETASVSVFDRGFLYGDAVFETIGTYSGEPFALANHLQRLARSAQRVLIELPVPLAQLTLEIQQAVARGGNRESYVRVMVTRGKGSSLGLDPNLGLLPCRVVIVTELKRPSELEYASGIKTATFRGARPADMTSATGAKIANYLVAVLAMDHARQAGASEALLLDREGRAIEGATSNLFVVRNGAMLTAPGDAGILAGITRAYVLHLASELGISVELRAPELGELFGADEVFISSTVRELMPVISVDERIIGDGTPGPVTRRLHEAFRRAAHQNLALPASGD